MTGRQAGVHDHVYSRERQLVAIKQVRLIEFCIDDHDNLAALSRISGLRTFRLSTPALYFWKISEKLMNPY